MSPLRLMLDYKVQGHLFVITQHKVAYVHLLNPNSWSRGSDWMVKRLSRLWWSRSPQLLIQNARFILQW